jgi:SAM-dependent methyltransferase
MRTVLRNLARSTGVIHAVRGVRRALGRQARRLGWGRGPRSQWSSGLASEIRYWRGYLESRGGNWPEEFAARLDRSGRMLDPFLARHLPPDQTRSRILDVGSGPLSILGYPVAPDGRTIDLVATDALAMQYGEMLKEFELVPASVPIAVGVEDLSSRFGEGEFDLVHMRNALDHCADPLLGIRQMIHVVRPGGYVLLQHYPNEADHANYTGLHCWNIDERAGRLYLSRPPEVIDVAAQLAGAAELRTWRDERWIYCAIQRLRRDAIRMP